MREREFDPLVAFRREEREHERASESLDQRGRRVLGEVGEGLVRREREEGRERMRERLGFRALERAEEEIGRSEDLHARVDEAIAGTERLLGSGPTVSSPIDLATSSRLPLPGLAIGSPRHHHTTSDSRLSSPPSSPRSSDDNMPLGTSASRALHFLSNLRSRRRVPRSTAGGPAIEDDPPRGEVREDQDQSTSWFQARRALESELTAPRLWGQMAPGGAGNRGRGPTARANELWRSGRAPGGSEGPREETRCRSNDLATPRSPTDDFWGEPAMRESGSGEAPPWMREESPSAGRGMDEFERGFEDWWSEGRGRAREAMELRERQRASFSSRRILTPTSLFSPLPAAAPSTSESTTTTGRPAIRIPRPTFPSVRYAERRAERVANMFAEDEEEEGQVPAEREWRPPSLPLMLPSGSSGRRFVFSHPANAAGPSGSGERAVGDEDRDLGARFESNDVEVRVSPRGSWCAFLTKLHIWQHGHDATRSRYHPAFGFEATRYTPSTALRPNEDPSLRPFGANPPTVNAAPERPPLPRLPVRGASLADALARFGSRSEPTDATLRRRHFSGEARAEADNSDSSDRSLQRQVRSERLASLRRERAAMRSLLGGMAGGAEPLEEPREASPPTSPGGRRRGLSDFLRGIGGGRARLGALFFDDEFPHFFGRDSAALDPRNYLVRSPSSAVLG